MSWLINLEPLKIYPDFRRWWIVSSLSAIGNHLTVFAATLQIFMLSKNPLAIGIVGLFTGMPAILLALWGGILIDKFDRRSIMFIANLLQLIGSIGLLINSYLEGNNIFFLYCMIGWIFLLGAINVPASSAILPRLINPKHLQAAITLKMFSSQTSMIIAPLIGGFLAVKFGITMLYLIDCLSFCASLYGIMRMPSIKPIKNITAKSWLTVKSAIRFLPKSPILLGALYVDFSLTFFGMPNVLLPAINDHLFNGLASNLGLMLAAISSGGLIALVLSGFLNCLKNKTNIMVILCIFWSLTVICFSLSNSFIVSLLSLFFMGALDSMIANLRSTIIQSVTPDEQRGRISALEYIVSNVGPQLGNVRAGILGIFLAPQIAALIGGLSTLILVLLTFVIFPSFIYSKRID